MTKLELIGEPYEKPKVCVEQLNKFLALSDTERKALLNLHGPELIQSLQLLIYSASEVIKIVEKCTK